MPVTKITLSTAMRARDVSRPHEEHLAEAAEHEETAPRPAPPSPAPAPPKLAPLADKPSTPPAETQPVDAPPTRRRRRRRS